MNAEQHRQLWRARNFRLVGLLIAGVELIAGNAMLATSWATVGLLLMLCAAGMALATVLPTLTIRRIKQDGRQILPQMGRGVFIQPEVGLPPGFVLPSAGLTPPESVPPLTSMPRVVVTPASKPPMSALPPTASESWTMMSRRGIAILPHDGPTITPLPGVSMADVEAGMTRLAAALGPCSHPDAVPVDQPKMIGGKRVAWLCPDPECYAQLPADWSVG